MNEHLDFKFTAGILAKASGRALGGVIAKFKRFRDVGFPTFAISCLKGNAVYTLSVIMVDSCMTLSLE